MIFLEHIASGRVERARCRHCVFHLPVHGGRPDERPSYMLRCSTEKDEYGCWINIKEVPLNKLACPKFQPRPAWKLFDSMTQLTLF